MRTVARVTYHFKRWQAIINDKRWQIKDNQCWSMTSARKTVIESSALCQSVEKQRWKVATETETKMTNMTNKGGRWQRKQIWQTKPIQTWIETIWSKKIKFLGKSYVTAVVFGANGHFFWAGLLSEKAEFVPQDKSLQAVELRHQDKLWLSKFVLFHCSTKAFFSSLWRQVEFSWLPLSLDGSFDAEGIILYVSAKSAKKLIFHIGNSSRCEERQWKDEIWYFGTGKSSRSQMKSPAVKFLQTFSSITNRKNVEKEFCINAVIT